MLDGHENQFDFFKAVTNFFYKSIGNSSRVEDMALENA